MLSLQNKETDYILISKEQANIFVKELNNIKNIEAKVLPCSIKGCYQENIKKIQIQKQIYTIMDKINLNTLYNPIKDKYKQYFYID